MTQIAVNVIDRYKRLHKYVIRFNLSPRYPISHFETYSEASQAVGCAYFSVLWQMLLMRLRLEMCF